jgi:hypothetical protein
MATMDITTMAAIDTNTWTTWTSSPMSTTSVTMCDEVWVEWASGTGGTASIATTATDNTIWVQWTGTGGFTVEVYKDRAIKQQQAREAAARREKEKKDKAITLLKDTLTRKQKRDLERHNYFYVRGGKTKNLYRIKHGRAGNVQLLDHNKKVKEVLCAHPHIYCPHEDTMLAQKIMIEHMEELFRQTANITVH